MTLSNHRSDGDWRDDRIGSAHEGRNPMVMVRMPTGFAVIGDTQHLPGYCVLLHHDAGIRHLTDLPLDARCSFLRDLALLGEAVERACAGSSLARINYEILGNSLPVLHGHVHARYKWEEPAMRTGPVWRYPKTVRYAPDHAYCDETHGPLRTAITRELTALLQDL